MGKGCLTGVGQASAYEEPFCLRKAANYDTSCPGRERKFQFAVVYSRHMLVGEKALHPYIF